MMIKEDEKLNNQEVDEDEEDGLTEPNILSGEKYEPRKENVMINPDDIVLKPPLHGGKRPLIQLKVTGRSQELAEQLLSGTFSAHQATKEALAK